MSQISVIIIVRNGEMFLPFALDSIVGQTLPPGEILVVDGNSSDRSREVAYSFPNVRVISQTGEGIAAARDQGCAAARFERVAFLDSDDVWEPDKLKRQAVYLERHPDFDAVTCHMVRFLTDGCLLPPRFAGEWLEKPFPAYTPGGLLARIDLFKRIGGFAGTLGVAWDSDWFLRARDAGVNLHVLPEVLLQKRIHEGNISHDLAGARREVLAMTRQSLKRRGIFKKGEKGR